MTSILNQNIVAAFIPPEKLGTPAMSDSPFKLLPTASNHAASLDGLYVFLTVICGISMVLVIGAMVYFMVKYKKRSDADKTSPINHNARLEFWWSAIPAVFLMWVFIWGEIDFVKLSTPPSDALDIRVTGQKWQWTIEYPNFPGGASVDKETGAPLLIVPKDQPVRLTMTSIDVIHSFYVPAFRVKKDVVPGRYAHVWFTPIELGEFPVFCAEYCGDEHSSMLAKVKVVEADEYAAIVAEATKLERDVDGGETMPAFGERVYHIKGCDACHTTDGSPKVGPSFKGVFGKTEQFSDGTSAEVDDNYVRESILNPNAKIVTGFPPQMPSFQGQLDEEQLAALIEYIKSLK